MSVPISSAPPFGRAVITSDGTTAVELVFDGLTRSVSFYAADDGWAFDREGEEGSALDIEVPIPAGAWTSVAVPGWDSRIGSKLYVQAPSAGLDLIVVASR